jgi:hypothetical protein
LLGSSIILNLKNLIHWFLKTYSKFILYHNGYSITLGCLAISGVTSCYQPRPWLTNVGWVTKPGYDHISGMGTPTCIVSVLILIGNKEVMSFSLNNCFSLSSTKGQFLNSCPTY